MHLRRATDQDCCAQLRDSVTDTEGASAFCVAAEGQSQPSEEQECDEEEGLEAQHLPLVVVVDVVELQGRHARKHLQLIIAKLVDHLRHPCVVQEVHI